MRLIKLFGLRLTLALCVVVAMWGGLFYSSMIDEVNDEVDDMLEEYSEDLMTRFLAGETLPQMSSQTNNEYYITSLSPSEALASPPITYRDSMIYIRHEHETEPARILTHIFQDDQGQYYRLLVATPNIEKQDLLLNILYWVVVLLAGLTLSILVVSLWIYHQTNKPLRRLLRWLQDYRLGENNRLLENKTQILEFRQLNEAATLHAERAERLFAEQKTFIGNISHELQTPIAIIRHRLESLMERDDLGEDQMQQLALIYERLEYMTRLNKTLLLLSRIDNGQFSEYAPIDIRGAIEHLLSDYGEVYAHTGLLIETSLPPHPTIVLEKTLIGILLSNLLKNAFIHTPRQGRINVELCDYTLTIRNSATEEGALEQDKIFDRFYQSPHRPEGSTGLGLALVRAICTVEAIALRYHFADGEHIFSLTFPKKHL